MNIWRVIKDKYLCVLLILIAIKLSFNAGTFLFPELSTMLTNQVERETIWTYDPSELKKIFLHHDRNVLGKRLSFETIKTIRQLRLNKRKRGVRGGVKLFSDHLMAEESRENNLMILNTNKKISNGTKLTFATLNARSIKNKDELIHEYLDTNGVDIAVVTETWLTECDDLWLQVANVNSGKNKTYISNRKNRKGGGLALITTMQCIKVTKMKETCNKDMQTCHWRVDVKGLTLNVFAVYRPPYEFNEDE